MKWGLIVRCSTLVLCLYIWISPKALILVRVQSKDHISMETSGKVVCVFFLCAMVTVVRSISDLETHSDASLTSTNGEMENQTHEDVAVKRKNGNWGGEFGWGWGGGGGGGSGGGGGGSGGGSGKGSGKGGPNGGGGGGGGVSKRGGWGGGWGGGGGGSYKWGCHNVKQKHIVGGRINKQKKRDFSSKNYKVGEFAQCMVEGTCKGMRLDCPLHCGGPCYYDCRFMCKAHCSRKL